MGKYGVYRLKAANPQYDCTSEIVVAEVAESHAIEMAEERVNCALNIVEFLGFKELESPCVISNTFK